ncbi:DUF881 domain-containing protein [Thermotalea metallivorans]|uniref:Division initiation protein n=1 Tax=Thermotalea metallivorans TaxID=520762 RepID=A0A140L5V9_9FIRM|nr:DUF881 domain-containing protein [Thermotalea metallivorans]KXG75934.1 hypothetical protein AN619_13970 [Thermotalea metallivorans]
MKGIKGRLVVGMVCVVLGLVLALQFRSVQGNYDDWRAPTQKAQELAGQLKKIRDEKQKLLTQINALELKKKEIEEIESKEDGLIKSLGEELEKYKIISGARSVKGPGVVVVVDDPPPGSEYASDVSVIMVNYDLLLSLINKLNDAGAEAISINDQRIVSNTAIHLAGNNVNINAVPTGPPFVIKAIGNPDTLEATLNVRFGIVWVMRDTYNLQITVKKQDEVIIPGYNQITKFIYAKPVESTVQ